LALDTKYRPMTYASVLGQDASVQVLRQFVKEGKGFQQSYVFCGQHGSGKTTLGRILARALLCENPQDGEPCDQCSSCDIFLRGGTHENFEELDAASKSKVSDLERIVEDIAYSTFSGSRRIYLFDESHQLSKKALDILLKPMEDNVEGSEDKKLVCIFCTTEPDKMRSTIFSRCAPAFVIRAVTPEGIADRLAHVCEQEGIAYEKDALVTIAEITECHIRDALKTVEGVSMLGEVTRQTVFKYLQLGANDKILDLLENLGKDLPRVIDMATSLSMDISPSSAYERISEAALFAYQAFLKVGRPPSQWSPDRLAHISSLGEALLGVSTRFASPPHRPTRSTLVVDLASAHYALLGGTSPHEAAKVVVQVSAPQPRPNPESYSEPAQKKEEPRGAEENQRAEGKITTTTAPVATPSPGITKGKKGSTNEGGVYLDERAIRRGEEESGAPGTVRSPASSGSLAPDTFRDLVLFHLSSGS
jgi:DNA polymerase III subunit gamma/tau